MCITYTRRSAPRIDTKVPRRDHLHLVTTLDAHLHTIDRRRDVTEIEDEELYLFFFVDEILGARRSTMLREGFWEISDAEDRAHLCL